MTPFEELLKKGQGKDMIPQKSKEARDWYRKVQRGASVTQEDLLKTRARTQSNISVGDMVFFQYDAKHKDTLPYWDAFPLVFPFDEGRGYFLGLNVHYLPYKHRAILMDQLYTLTNDNKYNERTKLRLSYDTIRSFQGSSYAKPCIKKYLKQHVRSRFIRVNQDEWDIALFLPVADFRGADQTSVWNDSKRKIRS